MLVKLGKTSFATALLHKEDAILALLPVQTSS